MKIDWDSEEAKGCDYLFTRIGSNEYYFTQSAAPPDKLGIWALHERPAQELIYTQEMVSNGEGCKMGMKFETEAGEYIASLVNDKTIVFEDEQGFYVSINKSTAKPIDTRTHEHKHKKTKKWQLKVYRMLWKTASAQALKTMQK